MKLKNYTGEGIGQRKLSKKEKALIGVLVAAGVAVGFHQGWRLSSLKNVRRIAVLENEIGLLQDAHRTASASLDLALSALSKEDVIDFSKITDTTETETITIVTYDTSGIQHAFTLLCGRSVVEKPVIIEDESKKTQPTNLENEK